MLELIYGLEGFVKGLTKELVGSLSKIKNDPEWMRDLRLEALDWYEQLMVPQWAPELGGLNLEEVETYVRPQAEMVGNWDEVPAEIRETFEKLGIPEAEKNDLAGVGAQYDSELVYHNIKKQVAGQGVVYLGIEEAIKSQKEVAFRGERRKICDLVEEYFMKLVPVSDHKFAALHGAVWSGGSFVFVPTGVVVELPLQSYFRFNAPGAGQFEHTLIIVDEGAELYFIEGCSAPKYNVANLHAGCVELYVGRNASLHYSTVESWSKNMYNLNTKRAKVLEGGKIEWVTGSFGSKVSMLYPTSILAGRGATAEYTGVTFAGAGQDLDTGLKIIHKAPKTCSIINMKSLAQDGGKSTYRSMVKITKEARDARSLADCKSLMLDNKSVSNTVPMIESESSTAEIGHEAAVGKISDTEIFYMMGRGMKAMTARALIVRGFTQDIAKKLPVEYAMEMNNLIAMEMERNT